MSKITSIRACEILDSRGNPTLEVRVVLENGLESKAAVPSGASTGVHEALELRDNNSNRYGGKGVLKACENVEKIIAPALIGLELNPQEIDKLMIDLDGTPNKSKLGANAILGVSLACTRAGAKSQNIPLYKYIRETYQLTNLLTYQLPIPMLNVINGGRHADNKLDIQEFMIVPLADSLKNQPNKLFKERIRLSAEFFQILKNIIKSTYGFSIAVGDEGGFAPSFKNNEEVLKVLMSAAQEAKLKIGQDIVFALDAAASEFYDVKEKKYIFENKKLSSQDMIDLYQTWIEKYPIISIEDGLSEDDWSGWRDLHARLQKIMIIGDDLFTTNIDHLKKGIEERAANSILIKPNQIGTLTETINCIKFAQANNYKVVISHRSGETSDDFISDLAVAVNADFIKAGAPNRGERVVKYNRLMEIEEELYQI
ncbi:MAG: phosphopyruvate hydratase [Patescibacteria group bacterium]|nr:phosphopyruvate hydratase [Patescibacteria group bacterium]MDD5164163.1 phosphopyruvate hydratase [Patescibacteria group bacterium]MDD5534503.1 phosphopyruvate hydratase [Patescibacteria group bacterium]